MIHMTKRNHAGKNRMAMVVLMVLGMNLLCLSPYSAYAGSVKEEGKTVQEESNNPKSAESLGTQKGAMGSISINAQDMIDAANKDSSSSGKTDSNKDSSGLASVPINANDIVHAVDKEIKDQKKAAQGSPDSWTSDMDTSIYVGNVQEIEDNELEEDPGILESLLIALLKAIGDWGNNFFENIHATLDSIILGRVGGHGVTMNGYNVALYTFELRPGNPYGVVAAAAYSTFRNIIYIFLLLIVMGKIAAASYAGGSAKAVSALKESISSFALAAVMLTVMPYVFDVLLYVRDVGLYTVAVSLGKNILNLDIGGLSLVGMFRENADKSIMNALMYDGSLLLTLYFVLQYVGLALSYVVYFFAFPFVCMNMQFDKKALGEWWKGMMYSMVVPIADVMLLFIPLSFGNLGSSLPVQVLQLIVCSMLLPTRMQLRGAMGIHTSLGMELAGISTMMGAMSLAKSAVGGVAKMATGVGSAVSGGVRDMRMSKMYGEMASENYAQQNSYQNMFNRENGYGYSLQNGNQVPGENEITGVDSYSSGIAGLSNAYGLPTGAFDKDGFNNRKESLLSTTGRVGLSAGLGSGASQSILEKYANTSNFESPEFRNLSPEKKAQLYKKRAVQSFSKGIGSALGGTAAGALGTTLGLGATTFMSPASKMQAMAVGLDAGGAIGAGVGGLAGNALGGLTYSGISKGVETAGTRMAEDYMKNITVDPPDMGIPEVQNAYDRFQASMGGISDAEVKAMDLNSFQQYVVSDSNTDMEQYMDSIYSSVNATQYTADEKQNEMSRLCVEHAMELSKPYLDKNISNKNEGMPSELLDALQQQQERNTRTYYSNSFSPENMKMMRGGKYTFQ